jgi:hypothetical protein
MRYPATRRSPTAPEPVPVRIVGGAADEIERLHVMLKGYEHLCEEQRFQIMQLRLERDDAVRIAEQLAELRHAIAAIRSFSQL